MELTGASIAKALPKARPAPAAPDTPHALSDIRKSATLRGVRLCPFTLRAVQCAFVDADIADFRHLMRCPNRSISCCVKVPESMRRISVLVARPFQVFDVCNFDVRVCWAHDRGFLAVREFFFSRSISDDDGL